ncbi:MAG: response regulator [Candidatus Thiodiazotropha sp. (ex Lucina aurantia)]|nr:response regulator [Candidatus Thiodiazotropha sp. (ex Lucina pensylvanica)]MBT3015517.1 response regulator [Candidatus Thiodiazotropha taylori]MBT3052993.1 response regulator [Candidatus Thiodiazotropha sp. (ex Codakia orbicularis)]MBV2103141.1 response regulator [Candidatus Thiodiazotropha sp. (ex Lucina aurantia)]MCG8096854.1 response regulator [Candidatus Thiodiazotropha endolucinida]
MYRKPWKRHYLSPGETAEILKVTPASLRGWTRKGILRAETTRGGHRRFPVSEVIRLARTKGLDVESSLLMSIRLLIIDSDIESCMALQKSLSSFAGVSKVEVAHDGFTAGCLVTQFHPDVILLDLNVPGIDSAQICSFIKRDHQTKFIRVIAMCRNCSKKLQKQIVNLGAEVCFLKPLPLNSLKQALGLEDLDD